MCCGRMILSLIVMSGCAVGCVRTDRVGMIPLGEWSGQGTFVFEEWGSDQEATTQPTYPKSVHRSYPTHLSIERVESGGQEFIVLDILSERGQLGDLGEETHLEVALVEAKIVSDSATLYHLVDCNFNPKPGESLDLRPSEPAPPFNASCIRTEGSTVLRLQYGANFTDTLRFRGNRVEKEGVYYEEKGGIVHWSEVLHRGRR